MIDYFMIFTNAAAAQIDSAVAPFWNAAAGDWDRSQTFPGISVVTPATLVNGINSLTGFWIMISQRAANPALGAICVMALDRDLGIVNGNFVLSATLAGANRTSLNFGPVPFGSGYPRPLGK